MKKQAPGHFIIYDVFDRLNFRSTLPIKLKRLASDKTLLMVF